MLDSKKYLVRRKIFALLGAEFEVFDDKGNTVLYAKQKAFKLREELKLYTDKTKSEEVFSIKARNIIDFSATYDVKDSKTGKVIGMLKRKGMRSILRDQWIVMDEKGKEVGVILEDSMSMAMVRRLLLNLIPQNFDFMIGDKRVADLKQQFNPFVYKMDVELLDNAADPRMVLATAILISLIEGRQE